MSIQNAVFILVLAFIGVALELAIYFVTGMQDALSGSGVSMVAAYKFLWMTVLTGALGVLAPLGALVTSSTGRKKLGLGLWIAVAGVVMLGYTALTFLNAPSSKAPVVPETVPPAPTEPALAGLSPLETTALEAPAPTEAATQALAVVPASATRAMADVVELAGTKVEPVDPEKLRVTLQFKNKSTRRITEIDYAFTFVDDQNRVLLSIDLREGLFIPPGLTGESSLDWAKSGFKDPAAFDKLKEAFDKGVLKTSVTLQRASLDDGSVAEA